MLHRLFTRRISSTHRAGKRFLSASQAAQPASSANIIRGNSEFTDPQRYFEDDDKTGIVVTLKDKKDALEKALGVFDKYGVSLSHIQSKPSKLCEKSKAYDFYLDFERPFTDMCIRNVISDLSKISKNFTIADPSEVSCFPTSFYDLDKTGKKILSEGDGIHEADHPGFRDEEYKKRRDFISELALKYEMNDKEIPRVEYTDAEVGVWQHCYSKFKKNYTTGAVKEFNEGLAQMEKYCGFSEDNIPQLEDISQYLISKTGWRIRPVGGQLSQRDFLNCLAFKVFPSSQYVRHHLVPEYTPEPDVIHEVMGHVPMFANEHYADLSQMIGLASLGCPDHYLSRLGTLYWFTIEFGLCMEAGKRKAYGAGILSSFGEFDWCFSQDRNAPKFFPFDCEEIAENHGGFPNSSVQPYYFISESWEDARKKIGEYCDSIPRPFNVSYNEETQTIEVDRKIKGSY
ncbi:unnamed protein product [Moneuplotes crassus]|uniref:phenylalanine 4-monooxygenase n=1 Tax=Euplotes crassus TaxID=5936 RepID=A0AAD1XBS7_EUPCR|nr:unnamed protein product [Moneuplotes crassus]